MRRLLLILILPCLVAQADEEKKPTPKTTGVRHTLTDKESTVVCIKGWTVARKDEENLIGWISSDQGKTHSHRIYRFAKNELEGKTGLDHAKAVFKRLTAGDKILVSSKWMPGDSHGGKASRKVTHLLSDVSGDDEKEDVWLIVESKEFNDRVYLQVVYHQAPLEKAKLKLINVVLDSVRPLPNRGKEPQDEKGN